MCKLVELTAWLRKRKTTYEKNEYFLQILLFTKKSRETMIKMYNAITQFFLCRADPPVRSHLQQAVQ